MGLTSRHLGKPGPFAIPQAQYPAEGMPLQFSEVSTDRKLSKLPLLQLKLALMTDVPGFFNLLHAGTGYVATRNQSTANRDIWG